MTNRDYEQQREKARQEYLKTNKMLYEKIGISNSVSSSSSAAGNKRSIPTVTTDSYNLHFNATVDLTGTLVSDGNLPVTEIGFCWSTNINPTINDNKITTIGLSPSIPLVGDQYTITNIDMMVYADTTVYARAYAINDDGVAYGDNVDFSPMICLVRGTKITLSNGLYKNIEDITYEDELLVWDFDNGEYATSKPLWIKKPQTTNRYSKLVFDDGSVLNIVNQHRIFNTNSGKFTAAMTDETPLNTNTFSNKNGKAALVSKEIINDTAEYYNLITYKHMNFFAEDILTSCRFNNIYPIVNNKFVKNEKLFRFKEEFNVDDKYYYGMRLYEQNMTSDEINEYVARLIKYEAEYV